jgi:hypothetical protein
MALPLCSTCGGEAAVFASSRFIPTPRLSCVGCGQFLATCRLVSKGGRVIVEVWPSDDEFLQSVGISGGAS